MLELLAFAGFLACALPLVVIIARDGHRLWRRGVAAIAVIAVTGGAGLLPVGLLGAYLSRSVVGIGVAVLGGAVMLGAGFIRLPRTSRAHLRDTLTRLATTAGSIDLDDPGRAELMRQLSSLVEFRDPQTAELIDFVQRYYREMMDGTWDPTDPVYLREHQRIARLQDDLFR